MELRNYKLKLMNKLNQTNKKEEIKMELRRISYGIRDILAETVFALSDCVNNIKTKLPKDLVKDYSTEGEFYGFDYRGIGSIEGFRVVKASFLMRSSFIYFGGVYMGFPTEDKYTDKVITVDENFDVLSTNAKRFVLYHEVGHLKDSRGFEKLQEDALIRGHESNEELISKSEKIADDYAFLKIGKKNSIKALKEILSLIENSFLNTEELIARIERLERKEEPNVK